MTITIDAPATDAGFTTDLPEWAVAAYEAKITKANRKAERNGLGSPFALTVLNWTERKRTLYGVEVTERWAEVRITGDSPSLPGWSFAATVDWTLTEPVLNVSPFYAGPTLPRPESKVCEHCGTIRSRNETFLVTGPEGAIKQVGRQCLTAFTGIPLGWVQLERDVAEGDPDDWFAGASADSFTYDVRSVVGLGVQFTDALGYVSQAKAVDTGTPSTRDRFLIAWHGPYGDRERAIQQQTEAALATRSRSDAEVAAEVEAIIAWGAGVGGSDYLNNLHAILGEQGWIGRRHLGYALSAVGAYRREQANIARRAAVAATRAPVTEGRYAITGKVLAVEVREGYYGPQVKCRIELAGGTILWGTLPRAAASAVPGDTIAFTATVERSERDATFGFFQRPTGARVTARAAA